MIHLFNFIQSLQYTAQFFASIGGNGECLSLNLMIDCSCTQFYIVSSVFLLIKSDFDFDLQMSLTMAVR